MESLRMLGRAIAAAATLVLLIAPAAHADRDHRHASDFRSFFASLFDFGRHADHHSDRHDRDGRNDHQCRAGETAPRYKDWPHIKSDIEHDYRVEREIANMVAKMSLAQKIGQMTQAEIQAITPDEARQFHIGSVLNGGGSWPGGNKHATPADWLALADAFWTASMTDAPNDQVTVRINAGGGAVAPYSADSGAVGGQSANTPLAIDTSLLSDPVPPQAVLQSERYGNIAYTVGGFAPGSMATVTLYFREGYWTEVGARVFDVRINGGTVLSNFDVFAKAGERYRAIQRSFTLPADANGQFLIEFVTLVDNALVSAIRIEGHMTTGTAVKIPILWGIDAVHGNNNVYGATLFPHNIGLGATRNPCLIRRIGEATAKQVRATGQDWTFAPTLAVARDDRWGRTYESYSENPAIVRAYAGEMVRGLQDKGTGGNRLHGILATTKHFIGDGGTDQGRDQGINMASEAELRNIHGQGYFAGLEAGAQTVMATYNSWTNETLGIDEGKVHGSRYLLTEVLKNKMGFDGFVVSDWNAIGQIPECTNYRCAQAINAGIDMVMVPFDWRLFISNTIDLVQRGEIPMSRIDDAVTRILRVKYRAGLFKLPKPSQRAGAGELVRQPIRELARQAVRESLVLLKNNKNVLPLNRHSRVLVIGKSADSMQNQTGGWSLTWQGTGNTNADFPNGQTILGGIRDTVGEKNVTFSETGEGVNVGAFDAVIAVIGEVPYAEGTGDIGRTRTLEHARRHPLDLAALDRVSNRGVPVITVFVSGRPLYTNKEINRSDAFVAAWLPGTEGGGVADVLFRDRNGKIKYDFTGKLPFSWPKEQCQTPLNIGDPGYDPLFPYGYGLTYGNRVTVGLLPETTQQTGCGQLSGGPIPTEDLRVYDGGDVAPWSLYIGSPSRWDYLIGGQDPLTSDDGNITVRTDSLAPGLAGKRAAWNSVGGAGQIYSQAAAQINLAGHMDVNSALVFDAVVHRRPDGNVFMRVDCTWPCIGELNATNLYANLLPLGERTTVKIPVSCFADAGTDLQLVNTPFLIYTDNLFDVSIANIRWTLGAADHTDAFNCDVTGNIIR